MNKVHYNVSGLLNNQIKTQVKHVLNELYGVQTINIDLARSSIEVGYHDNLINENSIKQGIEHAGCRII